ncbi:MAG: apolipoprotein N-acyltransferase [Acidimicrobiales bacterium]|nr:apolipoprotein N-acyltransferase [Acidimicrobiales bacterium]
MTDDIDQPAGFELTNLGPGPSGLMAKIPEPVRAFFARPVVRGIIAGLLIAASMPPWGWWPLAFAGIAVFDLLLAGASVKQRLGRGFVTGLALFVPTISWISQLTFPGYLIASLAYALMVGVAAMAVPPHWGRRPALIGAWVLCESLRSAWPFGGVPLSLLAVGQVAGPYAPIARVGGVLLIAVATLALGLFFSAALSGEPRRVMVIPLLASALLSLLAMVAPKGTDTGRTVDVAYVQGGGPQGTRAINTDERKVFERHLEASQDVPPGLDLVLWPEDVVDTDRTVQEAEEGRELEELAAQLDATLIVGTVEGVSNEEFRNSSQVVTAEGEWIDQFIKVQRVPFGEFVPFRTLIEKVAPDTLASRDATVSHQSGLLTTPEAKLATVISWEVFFGHRARSGVAAGGEILYNPTNGATYTGTLVQTQQVASTRLRAIETGRWAVQVSPTGFSAFVSPTGEVFQRSSQVHPRVEVRRGMPLRDGETWYVRWGDTPARVLAVLLLAAGWVLDRRWRNRPLDLGPVKGGWGRLRLPGA